MPIDLEGKTIIITGAGTGIGRATALACAAQGMRVVLNGRRPERLDDVLADIGRRVGPGRALAVPGDVRDPDLGARLTDACARAFGEVYACFANAGYGGDAAFAATTDAAIRDVFETNFFGTISTIRPALDAMLAAGRGHVLICSSAIGKIGVPYYGAYCATKAAQSVLGRALAHEVSHLGVHVSTVHPIKTRTEFGESVDRIGSRPERRRETPMGLVQSSERVARSVLRALRRPRTEVWTSTPSRLGIALLTAVPLLGDAVLGSFARAKRRNDPALARR